MAVKLGKYCDSPPQGGIYDIYYIDTENADGDIGLVSTQGTYMGNITTNPAAWSQLPIHHTNGRMRSRMKSDDQGKYYENTVPGQIRAMKGKLNYLLDKMSNYRYILRFVDKATQKEYIVGNPHYPLKFTYDFDSRQSDGSAVYDIEFFNESTYPLLNLPPA